MSTATLFVSSVQRDLAEERRAVRAFVEGGSILRRFFTASLFEDLPAADARADAVYLDEVVRAEPCVGSFGNEYGCEDVNAVAHRDYTSNASVQVMLFADRLEVWNPGELPRPPTFEALRRAHPSISRNPLIAEPLYLAGYIERAGSGTLDMIAKLRGAGLPEPEFRQDGGIFVQALRRPPAPGPAEATGEVTPEVRLVQVLVGEMTRQQLQDALGLKHEDHFRKAYLQPALEAGLIEMTIPDKPRSSRQRYRLTPEGMEARKKR